MKIPEIKDAFNTTSSGREPHGVSNGLDRHVKRRGLDVNKWLVDHLPPTRPLDTMPFFRVPDSPFYNFHPMRPSGSLKGPPLENTPTLPSFDKSPPMEPVFDNWPPMTSTEWSHSFNHIEMDFKMIDFEPYMPTPPPHAAGLFMVRTLGGAVGGIVVLLLVATCIRGKAIRTRRGRVIGVGAVPQGRLRISTDQPSILNYPRRPSEQREPGRPLNNDLPPSYYECALSSIKKYVSDEPPPYTYSKDAEPQVHTRRQNALIENKLGGNAVAMTTTSKDSEDVAPGMRSELVFDNGRIVERLSLDLNSKTKKTGVASNDNVEKQSTRHANDKDRVVYVDETDKLKVNTQ